MKSKQAAGSKKQPIVVKDLKAKKNPKGGGYDLMKNTLTVGSSACTLKIR
jgi:hypothetical protein